jgi:hypothetical protein
MDILETLKKYIALIGIVSTIGGGFYAWGVFNNRLDELEQSTNAKAVKQENKCSRKRIACIRNKV